MQKEKQLFDRYLRNACTPEEADRVLAWLATPEGEKHLLAGMERDLAAAPGMTEPGEPTAAARRTWTAIGRELDAGKTRPLWFRPMAVAASVAVLLALVGYWLLPSPAPRAVTYRTGYGQTREITLPEGSRVVLNGNSTLSFPADWPARGPREVWLDGEAFFVVTHRPDHRKFVVTTPGRLRVEVLGTEFNVYQRQQKTKVSLNVGAVQLHVGPAGGSGPLRMQPDELVEFDGRSERLIRKKVNAEMISSWKNKKLVFDNTSLREVIQLLRDTYGVKATVSDPDLLEERFSGTVPNENLNVLLDGLAGLFDLEITRRGNTIRITTR
ncbi:MAG: FecR domain-containing protein [Cytophagales bacterium]|nr:FecR domain-containing protein [Cytophagales bacterium]